MTPPLTTGSQHKPYGHHGCYLVDEIVTNSLKKVYGRKSNKEWMQFIDLKDTIVWSCLKICDALHYLLDIKFGSKLYRIVGSNWYQMRSDLFLFCYERDFSLFLSHNNYADVTDGFYSSSRYIYALLNIDNPYFEQMVSQIISH